jgi:hypothetical protein
MKTTTKKKKSKCKFSPGFYTPSSSSSTLQDGVVPTMRNEYFDYVSGINLTHRMPLYVKPMAKISLNETFWHFRNHYEDTPFNGVVVLYCIVLYCTDIVSY